MARREQMMMRDVGADNEAEARDEEDDDDEQDDDDGQDEEDDEEDADDPSQSTPGQPSKRSVHFSNDQHPQKRIRLTSEPTSSHRTTMNNDEEDEEEEEDEEDDEPVMSGALNWVPKSHDDLRQ